MGEVVTLSRVLNGRIDIRAMERLKKAEGREIEAELACYGRSEVLRGRLLFVRSFDCVCMKVDGGYATLLPFVGERSAIRSISAGGRKLYDNRMNIPRSYGMTGGDVGGARRNSFGPVVANFLELESALRRGLVEPRPDGHASLQKDPPSFGEMLRCIEYHLGQQLD